MSDKKEIVIKYLPNRDKFKKMKVKDLAMYIASLNIGFTVDIDDDTFPEELKPFFDRSELDLVEERKKRQEELAKQLEEMHAAQERGEDIEEVMNK